MIYWMSTGIIALFLCASGASYIFSDTTIKGVRELGFPDYFRIQLAVLKPIAAVILVLPSAPIQLKEWAYAGVALFLLTAIVAHYAHKDPWMLNLINFVLLALLTFSYFCLVRV